MTTASAPAPTHEFDGSDEPRPLVEGSLKRLLAWIIPANLSIFILWGAIPGVLLPLQVTAIDPASKVANLALVTTIGAFAAMIAQPVAGAISDRTRSRFGRRAPWMIGGALIGGLALIGMALANTLAMVAIAWTMVQVAYNFAQGPLSAILPDRVPRAARGTFAALAGMGAMLGALGGQIAGVALSANIPAAYLFLSGLALVVTVVFVVFNPDHSSRDQQNPPFSLRVFLSTFWVNPVAHPDFFWAFTGRLLLYTAYFAVTGYQLFILQDYIGLGDAAIESIPLFGLVGLVGMISAMVVGGPISDRLGRRKVFVFASTIVVALAMVVPLVMPTFVGWLVFTLIAGLGFGMFQSVDQALMSEVLPSKESYAKDLGVVNIAATLPQTLAPAVGGAIVLAFGGYAALFPVGIALAVLGAFAVWPIKAVK
ncbi:MFS transporter [Agromyces bauzanensis]|uniref:MFS transporter n=1 Tax=Agromyces bauzanensis TaxID=1308924 RepID=A0A917PUN8_9MICO|nr:MFS transporter [Agromyces bauzanensis]GGJ93176.1 MFS transporter [Agromyces bauzanensis]